MKRTRSAAQEKQRQLMMEIVREQGITDPSELFNTIRDMFAGTLEDMLKSELDEHLGYEKHDQGEKATSNRRNGSSAKRVISRVGELDIQVPRDRDGEFEPQVIAKGEKDISRIEEQVLSLYAKGMSDRDISCVVEDIYGFSVSHETISRIVDRIQPRLTAWQARELERVYAFLYVDAMYVKVKHDGRAVNKAVYSILGVNLDGHKDVLGFWVAETEGAHFWLGIFDELRARGVEQILFVCIDGLSGLEEGIQLIFPQTKVQRCMVHLVRNSLKYVPTKHYKAFCKDAKAIYAAVNLGQAQAALATLKATWGAEYPSAVRIWESGFRHVEQLFEFPAHIRRMIYTTNMVEGLHSALRKVTNGKAAFPNDLSVLKALFLRVLDLQKKWLMPVPNWALVLGQIRVLFPDFVWLP